MDKEIHKEIQKKCKAPRVTKNMVDGAIQSEQYHVFPGTTVTVCLLTLKNGFNTVGTAAAVSPENFDEAIGKKVARQKAVEKIWKLEGYLLKERLYQEKKSNSDA